MLVVIVGLAITASVAAQIYTRPQLPLSLKISGLYPPRAEIQAYSGPTLKVSVILVVLRLGGQEPVKLKLEALSTPYSVVPPAGATCLTTTHAGNTLMGPCYMETEVAAGGSENITFTIEAPIFPQNEVPPGYYRVAYTMPEPIVEQCAAQNTLYLNATLLLQANKQACITVQLVFAQYFWVGGWLG